MKVYIGKYKNWIGPYQLANMIPIISKDTSEKIGDWIAKTWVNKVCEWIHSKQERKIKVRVDEYDTWSMDNTLAHIILPMLKQLRTTKHGSPLVDDEDLPPHMRHTFSKGPDDYETDDSWIHYKWDWILSEIVWTFQELVNNDWEEKYMIEEGEIDFDDYPEDKGKDILPLRWKKEYVIDYEGRKNHQDRITNGLRLFGKYYQSLWS